MIAFPAMSHCSIVDEPKIEEGAIVVRVILEDPAAEDSGRVFVCRMTSFDDMTIETFPKGNAPGASGDERAEVAEFVRDYTGERLDYFSRLFEELAHRG